MRLDICVSDKKHAMKLHAFIQDNLDFIVDEWEAFARTLLPATKTMSPFALRNHSREILKRGLIWYSS
jgi:hypothetical protein